MSKRILIVDDSAAVRRGIANILRSRDCWEVCGEAYDGADALRKSHELQPDVILLDISMPGMSGLQAARLLREVVPRSKIVIMSQNDASLVLPAALVAGADGCIDKNRLYPDLLATLQLLPAVSKPGCGITDRVPDAGDRP